MSATPTALIFLPKMHRLHFVKEVVPPIPGSTFSNRAASVDTGAGRHAFAAGQTGRTNRLESEGSKRHTFAATNQQFSLAYGLSSGKGEGDKKKPSSLICVSCGTVNEIPSEEGSASKTEARRTSRATNSFIESISRRSGSTDRPSIFGASTASNVDSTHERQASVISGVSGHSNIDDTQEANGDTDSRNRRVSFNDDKKVTSPTKDAGPTNESKDEEATNVNGTHEKNVSDISGASASGQASIDDTQKMNGDNVKETSNEDKKCEDKTVANVDGTDEKNVVSANGQSNIDDTQEPNDEKVKETGNDENV